MLYEFLKMLSTNWTGLFCLESSYHTKSFVSHLKQQLLRLNISNLAIECSVGELNGKIMLNMLEIPFKDIYVIIVSTNYNPEGDNISGEHGGMMILRDWALRQKH